MITIRDHQSRQLFDPWEYLGENRRKLLDRIWARVFRDHLLQHLPVQEVAEQFREEVGRPSKDLHVALGALILQQLHDLTDEQTVEAIALNIAWHDALDIRNEKDTYLCERTLRNYRSKVVEHELDVVIFRSLTDKLVDKLDVDTTKQRLDSTAIRSAIRGLTRLGILVESISKFLREMRAKLPDTFSLTALHHVEKYLDRTGEGSFADTRPSESRRRLPEAARDLYEWLEQFRNTPAGRLASFQLMEEIFHQQCEVTEKPEPAVEVKPATKEGCDNILSPADPEARYNKHRGVGFLLQVMETYCPTEKDVDSTDHVSQPNIITHVAVGSMTTHDKDALEPAISDVEQRSAKPEVLLADSHYGSQDCLGRGSAHGVAVVSPAQTAKGKIQGHYALEDFGMADDGRVLTCPHDKEPESTSVSNSRLQVLFNEDDCRKCSEHYRCPASAIGRKTNRYQYTPERVAIRQRRLAENSDEFRDKYRWRAGVEATMCRMKHQMKMNNLRVRGMKMVRYVSFMRALGLNIRRSTKFLRYSMAG